MSSMVVEPILIDTTSRLLSPRTRQPQYTLNDVLHGHATVLYPLQIEKTNLMMIGFTPRFRSTQLPQPRPLMTPGEQERLLLQRTYSLAKLHQRTNQPPISGWTDLDMEYRRHTLIRVTAYFGSTQAVIQAPSSPFHLHPWELLHPFFDLLEQHLHQEHQITQLLVGYDKQDGHTLRAFWQARAFRADAIIPARLSKTIHGH
ncbi:MAG: hypothetical protein IT282_15760 [Bacteroidetes bacterium]|nr:hypothetical protein [Bacteroidota bacterium]